MTFINLYRKTIRIYGQNLYKQVPRTRSQCFDTYSKDSSIWNELHKVTLIFFNHTMSFTLIGGASDLFYKIFQLRRHSKYMFTVYNDVKNNSHLYTPKETYGFEALSSFYQ